MTSPAVSRCPICRADPETQIRFEERERIAAMVESLPTMVWVGPAAPQPYRPLTPGEIAAEIRRTT
jgi:hypothetical protein